MSLLKQIDDKGAVLAWSPISSYPNLVALGTKESSGVGFDDYGGELELHKLDLRNAREPSSILLGKARANSRFSSIAWSQMATNSQAYPLGLLAGGMTDGFIHLWNPSKLLEQKSDALIASIEQHAGGIRGLQFNPHRESSHLLASGGNDGEVYVMSLENPEAPNVFVPAPPPNTAKHTAEISQVAWNTQVSHILASASQNGSCFVWDLRQKKAWCELRDPTGGSVSDIAWNPDQGLNLITASGEDKNPVLKLWDLRSSTSLPLATLAGHTEGILSLSWCPNDASLLVSCGKDSQTILWDLFLLQPVFNLKSNATTDVSHDQSVFGGLASSAGQRRYHVSWSPCLPAIISACSFDRRIQFYSISGVKSSAGRAPKWLKRPVGASFGFGGKLVSIENGSGTFSFRVTQVVEDPVLVHAVNNFSHVMQSEDFKSYCEYKSGLVPNSLGEFVSSTASERDVWRLMKVIWFDTHAREELLKFLGFNSESIESIVEAYVSNGTLAPPSPAPATLLPPISPIPNANAVSFFGDTKVSAEDVFSSEVPITKPVQTLPVITPPPSSVLEKSKKEPASFQVIESIPSKETEEVIAYSMISGNFGAAIDCCIHAGLLAEALILAQCADQTLWLSTQERIFQLQLKKKPFLRMIYAVVKNDFHSYILNSDLKKWKETLALLSSYTVSENFAYLCQELGSRLMNEGKSVQFDEPDQHLKFATLCYMCASNANYTIDFWISELEAANRSKGSLDTLALQEFVEKVIVFTSKSQNFEYDSKTCEYFNVYANLLANQGKLDYAIYYLKGNQQQHQILLDRLFHAAGLNIPGVAGAMANKLKIKQPTFPFEKVVVNVVKAAAKPQQQPQQSFQSQPQNQARYPSQPTTTQTTSQFGQTQSAATGIGARGVAPEFSQNKQSYQTAQQAQGQAPIPTPSSLPPGWIEALDPASGRSYYINQATQQSQWERPAPVVVQVSPVASTSSFVPTSGTAAPYAVQQHSIPVPGGIRPQTQVQQQPQPQTQPVSSFQQPQLQNMFGSSPQLGQTQNQSQSQTQPISSYQQHQQGFGAPQQTLQQHPQTSTFNPAARPQQPVAPVVSTPLPVVKPFVNSEAVQALGAFIETIAGLNLNPAEKKQLQSINQSYAHLLEKAASNDIGQDVMNKIENLVVELNTRNYHAASAIQTDLANSVWAQHKEWLKGIKILIQLASKK